MIQGLHKQKKKLCTSNIYECEQEGILSKSSWVRPCVLKREWTQERFDLFCFLSYPHTWKHRLRTSRLTPTNRTENNIYISESYQIRRKLIIWKYIKSWTEGNCSQYCANELLVSMKRGMKSHFKLIVVNGLTKC